MWSSIAETTHTYLTTSYYCCSANCFHWNILLLSSRVYKLLVSLNNRNTRIDGKDRLVHLVALGNIDAIKIMKRKWKMSHQPLQCPLFVIFLFNSFRSLEEKSSAFARNWSNGPHLVDQWFWAEWCTERSNTRSTHQLFPANSRTSRSVQESRVYAITMHAPNANF